MAPSHANTWARNFGGGHKRLEVSFRRLWGLFLRGARAFQRRDSQRRNTVKIGMIKEYSGQFADTGSADSTTASSLT